MTTAQDKSIIGQALCFLATRCDHARSQDGQGFSGFDAETGHDLAKRFTQYGGFISEKQFRFAQRLALKYRRQLEEAGIAEVALRDATYTPKPEAPKAVASVVTFAGHIERETEKAILVRRECNTYWLPRSRTEIAPAGTAGYAFTVPAWMAAEKGIAA